MVNIWFMTREELEKRDFGKHVTVICFYGEGEEPLDIEGECEYICARLDDLSTAEYKERYGAAYQCKFFPDEETVAEMAIRAVAEGRTLYIQEDTRGASCAAAIMEFFTGGGMLVFDKSRCRQNDYSLNVEIYEKLYGTLCCMKLLMTDIDFDRLRTGRAAVNRQETISKIYDIMCEEYAAHKAGEEDAEDNGVREAFKTADGIYISVHEHNYIGNDNNEVFAFYSVTKDKVSHGYCGIICAEVLADFLSKYKKEDIEYFGVHFREENNDYGVMYMDSECGDSFTTEHLWTYLRIIDDKYEAKEQDIYD
ncbi:MAG: hypothetical protein IKH78_00325 [Ruminococcus sp.]|nr:hypothetical protein [Ruminococcus sp.]